MSPDTHPLPDVLPARCPDVDVADFDTEIVVFDGRVNNVHLLTSSVALVFDACDGVRRTEALVDEFLEAGVGDRNAVRDMVVEALTQLRALALLEGTVPATPPPCIGCAPTVVTRQRRRWLARR